MAWRPGHEAPRARSKGVEREATIRVRLALAGPRELVREQLSLLGRGNEDDRSPLDRSPTPVRHHAPYGDPGLEEQLHLADLAGRQRIEGQPGRLARRARVI